MRWPNDIKLRENAERLQRATWAFFAGCGRLGKRAWPLATSRKLTSWRVEASDWADRLEGEKSSLLSLVRGMETEFLATGAGLQRLARHLNEIQQQCRPLIELTLGQEPDAAVQFAFQLLKKAEDIVLASDDQYDHVFITFGELQRRLAQLHQQHKDLLRVLLPLNFITTALRIEASRQPAEVQEVFTTLAAGVDRTMDEVRGTLDRQFEELAASERIARSLMEQVSASTEPHRKEVASTLESSRKHLRALNEALSNSGAGATDLSHLNQAVTRHLGGLVMAQQCQDITRQKIEHVGEAMEVMRDHLAAGRQTTSTSHSETRQFVFQVGQIQLQHVRNVFDELNHAADSLKSGIQSLRTEAGAATEAAVQVGGTMLDAKVASQCQASIGAILALLAQAVRKIADILAAFEPFLQARFVNCISKATELASDVRHAALNAQIFAMRAPNGATLEVLAGRMRVISDEAIQQVVQLGGALQHTADMVNNLRQQLADFQQLGQAEQEVLTHESALSRKKLSNLESAIPGLIQRITRQQAPFAQSVEQTLANVQFPVTIAEGSSRSVGFFQDLVDWGSEGCSDLAAESAAARKIDLLRSNYTMESERAAHAVALQTVLAPASATASQPSIELFGESESPSPSANEPLGEIFSPSQRPEDPPGPAGAAAGENLCLEPAQPASSEKPAASENLGANVELF